MFDRDACKDCYECSGDFNSTDCFKCDWCFDCLKCENC